MINYIYYNFRKFVLFTFAFFTGLLFVVFPMVLDLLYIKNNLLILMVMYGLLLSFAKKYLSNLEIDHVIYQGCGNCESN